MHGTLHRRNCTTVKAFHHMNFAIRKLRMWSACSTMIMGNYTSYTCIYLGCSNKKARFRATLPSGCAISTYLQILEMVVFITWRATGYTTKNTFFQKALRTSTVQYTIYIFSTAYLFVNQKQLKLARLLNFVGAFCDPWFKTYRKHSPLPLLVFPFHVMRSWKDRQESYLRECAIH